MITRRGSSWRNGCGVVGRVVLACVALTTGVAAADHTTYSVPENKLGYSACVWPAGKTVRVGVDPAYPFPGADFSERLNDSIRRWNAVLSTARRPVGMVRVDASDADVIVQYRSTGTTEGHGVLGETYLQREGDPDLSPNIGRCPDRRPGTLVMRAAQIRINPRNDWYTGDDAAVDTWQRCNQASFRAANPALCASQVDFGSTIVHELGHSLVLYHPQTLDDIDGVAIDSPNSASTAARCFEATGSFSGQATLCGGQGVWRAEQRDLEPWDVQSAHKHYS